MLPCRRQYRHIWPVSPDGMLSSESRNNLWDISKRFQSVFNPNFGVYNDKSGPIRAAINLGPVEPPTQKGKLPFYNQTELQQLLKEADKLEKLGVLAKPENFLLKKPDGGFRFVTAFNNLSQYVCLPPTATMSCDDVFRRLSTFKYVIKTDFTKSFFQISLAKDSFPYLATVAPFRGLRVYLTSAMGMPG